MPPDVGARVRAPVSERPGGGPVRLRSAPALRRACACGGTPGPTGECDECRRKRQGLRRAASGAGPAVAPPVVHDVLRSSGRPLDAATRAFMEPRFGHSFADVRVHADARASDSARAVGAHAYAVGRDVVFAAGRYAPGSAEGRRLLAHELAHVVQQGGGGRVEGAALEVGAADDPAEWEADRAADDVVGGGRPRVGGGGAPPRLRRAAEPGPPPRDLECAAAATSPGGAVVELVFLRGSASLDAAQRGQLDAFAVSWNARPHRGDVRVDGYASEEDTGEYNWRLSCRRARAVREQLASGGGGGSPTVPAARIATVAHSETDEFGPGLVPNRRASVTTPEILPPAPEPSRPGPEREPRWDRAFMDLQIECVTRRGGCSLPGGIPTPEQIREWGEECRRETGYAGPSVTAADLACGEPGMGIARSLERAYPGWRRALPRCPCTDGEARARPDVWRPSGCLGAYHPGAASGYRSASAYSTAPGTRHGQQCCYDRQGRLMVGVQGAGTPDVWSPEVELYRHYIIDVRPFEHLGWEVYNRFWIPDPGEGCP